MRCIGMLALAACGAKADEQAAVREHAAPSERAQARHRAIPASSPSPRTVRWRNVVRTDGCFFFSGPEGRDDQLVGDVQVETVEREGERITIRIGTVSFEGTYTNGTLSLARKSKYDFNGPWQVTETIRGRVQDGGIIASYAYEECELAAPKCPGHCTVTGTLAFERGL